MTKRYLLIPALVYVVLNGCASVDQAVATAVSDETLAKLPQKAAALTPTDSLKATERQAVLLRQLEATMWSGLVSGAISRST